MTEAPRVISELIKQISIEGYVLPWKNGQAWWLRLKGTDDIFIPVFSSVEKLYDSPLFDYDDEFTVKKIDDQTEFLDNIPVRFMYVRIRIMVDPWVTEHGTIRYTEILRDG